MASCCREGFRRQVCDLYEYLLRNSLKYFDANNVLNSDGRRLFNILVRMLLEDASWLKRIVYEVRREPTLENIIKLGEIFYACSPYELLASRFGLLPYI